jgi:hypothetical protein
MAIIKTPPKQPKSVTVQARVEESVKEQLDMYAKFIDSTPNPRSNHNRNRVCMTCSNFLP